MTKDTVVAAKLALDHRAEIIVTGIMTAMPDKRSQSGGDNAKANLLIKAIDPTTARIFVTDEKTANAMAASLYEAMSQAG